MFNVLITVGAVDTLSLVFFHDAMQVGVQRCMVCSEAKYGSLMCSRVGLVWSFLVQVLVISPPSVASHIDSHKMHRHLSSRTMDLSLCQSL